VGTAQIVAGAGGEEEFAGLRESILQMRPGDLFVMDYVTMYGSMDTFRRDKGDMKAVGFADQEGAAFRRSARDDRLHTPRIPHIPRPGQVWELKTAAAGRPPHVAVLHFGFSQLANARMKNVVYNMFDVVTGTAKTPAEMNAGLDAMGITTAAQQRITRAALATAPPAWSYPPPRSHGGPAPGPGTSRARCLLALTPRWCPGAGARASGRRSTVPCSRPRRSRRGGRRACLRGWQRAPAPRASAASTRFACLRPTRPSPRSQGPTAPALAPCSRASPWASNRPSGGGDSDCTYTRGDEDGTQARRPRRARPPSPTSYSRAGHLRATPRRGAALPGAGTLRPVGAGCFPLAA